jgi:hypothetical protein
MFLRRFPVHCQVVLQRPNRRRWLGRFPVHFQVDWIIIFIQAFTTYGNKILQHAGIWASACIILMLGLRLQMEDHCMGFTLTNLKLREWACHSFCW